MSFISDKKVNVIKKILNATRCFEGVHGLLSRIVILRYHSVKQEPFEYDHLISQGIIHSEDIFYQQMEIVARHYTPISLDDLAGILRGRQAMPKKAVLVTFDDGYADNLDIVAPILDRFGIPGGFYLVVDAIDNAWTTWYTRLRYGFWVTSIPEWRNPSNGELHFLDCRENRVKAFIEICRACAAFGGSEQARFVNDVIASLEVDENGVYQDLMMTWSQVAQLRKMGHTIGSHTLKHPNLVFIKPSRAEKEVVASKSVIEKKLHTEVVHFSYPNPSLEPNCNEDLAALVENAGYLTAVTSNPGTVKAGGNPFMLPRMSVPHDRVEFLWRLNSLF